MNSLKSRLQDSFPRLWMPLIVSVCFAAVVFCSLWFFGLWNFMQVDTSTATGMAQRALCSGGVAVLLAVLIFILSREALREPHDKPAERPVWFYPLMSGLLSLGAMCVAYSFIGMWPCGQKTAMMVDMHHQYAPLLSGLRDALLNGELSVYSFEVGMGANYVSLAAYYLASPLNLLLLLFPEYLLAEGILFITLIKNALCGAMFALCVQQVFGKKSLCIPAASLMYSLMMYLLAYSWNIMWLDVLMVLPLVIYGFERLMKTGRYLTYTLSLAYALFANYYIGFMLCIFLVLYYATYCLRKRREGRDLAVSFGRFAAFSALAGAMTAAVLVPVFFALRTTSAAGSDLPDLKNTLDIFQLLGRHLAITSPTIRSGNLPNMYCGVLSAMCVPLFALNKGIPVRRRLAFIMLWLVMAFSFLVNWSDLAWHGLHAPNDLPYRFSFLYSFTLLLMAYQTLLCLKHVERKHVFAVFAGALIYLMLEEHFGAEAYGFETIYVNLILVVAYTVILALIAYRKLRRGLACALLLLAVSIEMTVGAGYALVQMNANEYYTRHEDYVDNDITMVLKAAVGKAQELGDAKYGKGNYRMEFMPRRTCVDTALFHYQGITTFSSSNYYTTTKLLGGLGYAVNGVNSHLYHNFMPFTDSLFGIRYLISDEELSDTQLKKQAIVSRGDITYYVYENTDALSFGYVVDSTAKDYMYTKYDPIASLEDLFGKLNDTYMQLFAYNGFEADENTGAMMGFDSTGFRVQPEDGGSAVFSATIETAGRVYVFADCMAAKAMTVRYNGKSVSASPNEPYLISVGKMQVGDQIHLEVNADQHCSGNFHVVTLNEDAYEAGMAVLAAEQWQATQLSSNHLKGDVDASFDGTFMTSIPYDAGWNVLVDGKKVETYGITDGLLAFDITAGKHTVEMVYYPSGWWVGLAVSAVAWLVLITLLVLSCKKRAKAAKLAVASYGDAQPVQGDFSVLEEPKTEIPPIPETFEELVSDQPENEAETKPEE